MNWTAIVKNKEVKIRSILTDIRKSTENNQSSDDELSLSSGLVGNTIFLIYHDVLLKRKCKIDFYSDILNKKLSSSNISASFMEGLSGISWFYYFLANSNLVNYELEFENSLKTIDEFILPSINIEAAKRNIDLFDGLNGYADYLIERGDYYNNYKDLNDLVKNYRRISINDESGTRWVDNRNHYKIIKEQNVALPEILLGEEVNLGLAHGMMGTIVILSKIFELNIKKTEVKKMLLSSIKWLLKQKINGGDHLFPFVPQNPKIGWCYGDLGVAYSITFAGKKMGNEKLVNTGIDLGLKSSKFTRTNAMIDSPYFCHGAAGIAHIYNRFYHLTGENQFLNQSLYWYDVLIEMYNPKNKIGGYFNNISNFSYGLQFGISGIGLVLMAGISNNEPKWDKCLLLS